MSEEIKKNQPGEGGELGGTAPGLYQGQGAVANLGIGGVDGVPGGDVDVGGARFGDRGHVGEDLRALARRDGQRLHLARLDVSDEPCHRRCIHVDLTANHIGDGRRIAFVSDVRHARAREQIEQFSGEMRDTAVA